MSFRIDVSQVNTAPGAYLSESGLTECVAFVREAPVAVGSTRAPPTGDWRMGQRVKGAAVGAILEGTIIATFTKAGFYPSASQGGRHAAVYLSHDGKGIKVMDQWNAQGCVKTRTLKFVGDEADRSSNRGDWFFVVGT